MKSGFGPQFVGALVLALLALGFGAEANHRRWSETTLQPVERSLGSDVLYFDGLPNDLNPDVKTPFDSALKLVDAGDFSGAAEQLQTITAGTQGSEAAAVYNLIGWCRLGNDELDDAIAGYHTSLGIAQGASDLTGQAVALDQIGATYFVNDGPPDSALKYLQQSLALYRTLNDQKGIYTDLGTLASVFDELGQDDSALSYHQAAITAETVNSDWDACGSEELWMGDILFKQNQADSALTCFLRSEKYYFGKDFDVNEPLVWHHMAPLYSKMGKDWFVAACLKQGKPQGDIDIIIPQLELLKD